MEYFSDGGRGQSIVTSYLRWSLTLCDDVWQEEGGQQIGQNRVTSFMDDPFDL